MPKTISRTTKRAARKGGRAVTPSVPYEPWLIEQLKNPAEAAAYLEAVIEESDQGALMLALRQIAQAQGGIVEIGRKAKLTREATYKMLSKSGNLELRSLKAVLTAMGLRIAVRPIVFTPEPRKFVRRSSGQHKGLWGKGYLKRERRAW